MAAPAANEAQLQGPQVPRAPQANVVQDILAEQPPGLLLGVTVHEFMLISMCQCLCHIMKVSWSHGFIGFLVSMVS